MSNEESGVAFGAVIKGAIVGGIAVVIESAVVGMLFMSGTPDSPAETEAMTKALMASRNYLLTDLGASLLCMALGGYVAAGSAGRSGAMHGAVTGVLLILLSGALFVLSPVHPPAWYTAVAFLLIIPAGALGGAVRGV